MSKMKFKITAIINIWDGRRSYLKFMDADFDSITPFIPDDIETVRADAIKSSNALTAIACANRRVKGIQIHQPMVWVYHPNGALSELFNPFEGG